MTPTEPTPGVRDRPGTPVPDPDQRRARALADATRFRLFEAIGGSPVPVGVAELTDRLGLRDSTVRYHLTQLRDGGLVVETREASGQPGRPRLTYTAPVATPRAYERLAALLAETVANGTTPRETGRAAGHRAAEAHALAGTPAAEAIAAEARALGFEPESRRRGLELVLHHCPFANVAADAPETVCGLHLGLAEGIAERLGGIEVVGMDVRDPYQAGCRLVLARRPGSPQPGSRRR